MLPAPVAREVHVLKLSPMSERVAQGKELIAKPSAPPNKAPHAIE
jgi:hypothetical protein